MIVQAFASDDRRPKDVLVPAVIIPKLELCNIEWHTFRAYFMKLPDYAVHEGRPEPLSRIRRQQEKTDSDPECHIKQIATPNLGGSQPSRKAVV